MWEKLRSWLFPVPVADGLVEAAPSVRVRETFWRFWPDVRPFRGLLCFILWMMVVSPVVEAARVGMFRSRVDAVATRCDFAAFPAVAAAFVGLKLLGGAVGFANQYLSAWIGLHFV